MMQQPGANADIAANIAVVRARIAEACERAGRRADDVTLIAVSKTMSAAAISEAVTSGQVHFGENRLQEAAGKIAQLPNLRWHLIGSLQTNKVKSALGLFQYIHSVDRPALVEAIARHAGPECPQLLMQVNVSGEASKHGIEPAQAIALARRISSANLPLVGLMTIAPQTSDPESVRPVFRRLREISGEIADLGLAGVSMECLSMGMSADFAVAVEEGATMVRVGGAIFGPRLYNGL